MFHIHRYSWFLLNFFFCEYSISWIQTTEATDPQLRLLGYLLNNVRIGKPFYIKIYRSEIFILQYVRLRSITYAELC